MKYAVLLPVLLIVIVAGCASTNNYPSDPAEQVNFHEKYANRYAEEKEYGTAAYHVSEMISKAGGPDRVKALLASGTNFRNGLTNYLCQEEGAIKTKEDLIKSMRLLTELDAKKLWDGVPGCRSRLDDMAARSERFKWTIEDDVLAFGSLASEERQEQLIDDSLEYFAKSPRGNYYGLASRYAEYVEKLEKSGKMNLASKARQAIANTYCAAVQRVQSTEMATGLMQSMTALRDKQPKIDLGKCIDQLDHTAAVRIANDSLRFTLLDDAASFKSLATEEMGAKRTINTISLLHDGKNKEHARSALTKHLDSLQKGSAEYKAIQQHIQVSEYPPRVLKVLEPYFPEVAGTKLHEIRTGIKQQAESSSGQQFTPMLEGCAAITNQQKKAACFESVMQLSKKTPAPPTATPYTKFDSIKRTAAALKSATDVGVTFIQYMPYIQQLATEVQLVRAMNNTKYELEALSYYEKAIDAYQDAHTFWNAWIDFYSRRDNKATYFGGLPIRQTNIGWIVNKYSIPTTNADLLGIWTGVTQSAALSTIWRTAQEYVQKGNEEI